MNFKIKTLPACLAIAALALTGCKDDVLMADGNGNQTGSQYSGKTVSVIADIALPFAGATRSATDSDNRQDGKTESDGKYDTGITGDEVEVGSDGENEIRSLLLVLASKDGSYISHAVAGSLEQLTGNSTGDYLVKAQIKFEHLEAAYADGGPLSANSADGTPKSESVDRTVNLYAFCNFTASILDKFDNISDNDKKGGWMDWNGEVNEDAQWAGTKPSINNSIWSDRSFLMTNWSDTNTCSFYDTIDKWDAHADPSNPFDLTSGKPIQVERVAARFDFADGSPSTTPENTYQIYTNVYRASESTEKKLNLFSIELTRMSLVNMSKEFYYLRRVSLDGQNYSKATATTANGWALGGRETTTNWIVDTDAALKATAKGLKPENASKHFNFRLYADALRDGEDYYDYESSNWYVDNIKTVLAGTQDNPDYTNSKSRDYRIWRYVTENTIPKAASGDPNSQQKTIQSTGIIFKGCIIAGEDLDEEAGEKYTSEEVRKALAASKAHFDPNDPKSTFIYNDVTYTGGNAQGANHFTYPVLYSYDNMLYAGIKDMVEAAHDAGQGSPLYLAVSHILGHYKLSGPEAQAPTETQNGKGSYDFTTDTPTDEDDVLTVEIANYMYRAQDNDPTLDPMVKDRYKDLKFGFADDEKNFRDLAPAQGIAIYIARDEKADNPAKDGAGWGYYCYYFYWNRHNDNLLSGKMGQMEFATVRNNIYKLAVTEISALGHPRTITNDPDPVKPEDPDEEPNRYITVEVEVLPWVVRLNDIKF